MMIGSQAHFAELAPAKVSLWPAGHEQVAAKVADFSRPEARELVRVERSASGLLYNTHIAHRRMNMDRKKKAKDLHENGCNCAQAVMLAFADKLDIDEELLHKMSEGFGAGMGTMNGTCGALSVAIMLAGLINSDGDVSHPASKGSTYGLNRKLYLAFTEKTGGASICRDLKGVDTGKVLYPCAACIAAGVDAVSEVLFGGTDNCQ